MAKPFTSFSPSLVNNPSGVIQTLGINSNEQLVIYNDSINVLQLTFPDNTIDIIPAAWAKDFILPNSPMGKVLWSIIGQLQSSNYQENLVYGALYEPGEHIDRVNTSMQRSPAVTPTASGDPIFTSTFRLTSAVGTFQSLNIYNPSGSGKFYTFHSLRAWTNDTGNHICRTFLIPTGDNNLPGNDANLGSHDGILNPRLSTAHVTDDDSVNAYRGGNDITFEVDGNNIPAGGAPFDFLLFPDNLTLYPDNNLLFQFGAGGAFIYNLTAKWSERTLITSPSFVAGVQTMPTAENFYHINVAGTVGTCDIYQWVTADGIRKITWIVLNPNFQSGALLQIPLPVNYVFSERVWSGLTGTGTCNFLLHGIAQTFSIANAFNAIPDGFNAVFTTTFPDFNNSFSSIGSNNSGLDTIQMNNVANGGARVLAVIIEGL